MSSQSKKILLIDFDHTLFDLGQIFQNVDNYDDGKKFVLAHEKLDEYLYSDAKAFIKTVSKLVTPVIFSEGELDYQKQKISKTSLDQEIGEANFLIFDAYEKEKRLEDLAKENEIVAIVDDNPRIIDKAITLGIPTIRIVRGKYKDETTTYVPTFEVESLDEIISSTLIQKILQPFSDVKKVHMVGIKGVGMTPVALILDDLGIKVTGSDYSDTQITDQILTERKISISSFNKENISDDVDLVIYSGAYKRETNEELLSAFSKKIHTISQAEALASLINEKQKLVCVCGVGGKTTTSAMIASIMDENKSGGWFVGVSRFNGDTVSGKIDESDYFVAEADEYAVSPPINLSPKFSLYLPKIVVCTNILYDHPDVYPDFDTTLKAFAELFNRVPKDGLLIIRLADLEKVRPYLDLSCQIQTYGIEDEADWKLLPSDNNQSYIIKSQDQEIEIKPWLIGAMNALNATAALAACSYLRINSELVINTLNEFKGVKRRLEIIKEEADILYLDDYGHHPREIEVTLASLKKVYPDRRLLVIFHPHTLSRTKALFKEFTQSFKNADHLIIAEIFTSAREQDDNSISSRDLVKEIAINQDGVEYGSSFGEIIDRVKQIRRPKDIILTLGAGDIYKIHDQL